MVQSFIGFGKNSETYDSLKKEYYSRCLQWQSNLEKAQTPIARPSRGFIYLCIGVYLRDLINASVTMPNLQGVKDDCNAMPTCHPGVFGCCVLVATGLCMIADNVFGYKRNEQEAICNEYQLFKTYYNDFEQFQKKISQNVDLEDSKANRLLEKIEKTGVQWKQKLDGCNKFKMNNEE